MALEGGSLNKCGTVRVSQGSGFWEESNATTRGTCDGVGSRLKDLEGSFSIRNGNPMHDVYSNTGYIAHGNKRMNRAQE